jgi:hypothetical protein
MTSAHRALDYPEDYLWVDLGLGRSTVIERRRLVKLRDGTTPDCLVEELLVANPRWLRFYLDHCIGDYVIEIPERGPLPKWKEDFVMAMEGPAAWDDAIGRLFKHDEPSLN